MTSKVVFKDKCKYKDRNQKSQYIYRNPFLLWCIWRNVLDVFSADSVSNPFFSTTLCDALSVVSVFRPKYAFYANLISVEILSNNVKTITIAIQTGNYYFELLFPKEFESRDDQNNFDVDVTAAVVYVVYRRRTHWYTLVGRLRGTSKTNRCTGSPVWLAEENATCPAERVSS